MSASMASLDAFDKPLPNSPISCTDILDRVPTFTPQLVTSCQLPTPLEIEVVQPRRISRLGPVSLTPCAEAGPSRGPRFLYVAVRRGRIPGVYTEWREAEKQVIVSSCYLRMCCADLPGSPRSPLQDLFHQDGSGGICQRVGWCRKALCSSESGFCKR
jgi:hypothetical protein